MTGDTLVDAVALLILLGLGGVVVLAWLQVWSMMK